LGCDIPTRGEYCRLHDSTIELAKISKLLMAVESSEPSSSKGKSLDSIDLSSDIDVNNDVEQSSDDDAVEIQSVDNLERFSISNDVGM